jgi:hypothetical protein
VSFLNAYQSSLDETLRSIQELSSLDGKFMDEAERRLDFLESRLGRFRVEAGSVYFDRSTDVDRYNEIMTALSNLTARERQLGQQAEQRREDGLRKIEAFEQLVQPNR